MENLEVRIFSVGQKSKRWILFGRFVDPIRRLGDAPLKSSIVIYLFIYLSGENLVDSPDTYGMSPLMIASQKGYTRLVSIIIVPFCTSTVIVKLIPQRQIFKTSIICQL